MQKGKFISYHQLEIPSEFFKEICKINPRIKQRHDNQNSFWSLDFSEACQTIIYRLFKIEKNYKASMSYLKEQLKSMNYIESELLNLFAEDFKETFTSKKFIVEKQFDFSYKMLEFNIHKKISHRLLTKDLNDLLKKIDSPPFYNSDIMLFTQMIRYFEAENMILEKNDFINIIKNSNDIFDQDIKSAYLSKLNDSNYKIESYDILYAIFERFIKNDFFWEKQSRLKKNLFEMKRRIRKEIFGKATDEGFTDFNKLLNSSKLKFLTTIQKIDGLTLIHKLEHSRNDHKLRQLIFKETSSYYYLNLLYESDLSLSLNLYHKMKNNYQIMLKEMQFFSYIGGNNDRSIILDLMESSLNIALKERDLDKKIFYLKESIKFSESMSYGEAGIAHRKKYSLLAYLSYFEILKVFEVNAEKSEVLVKLQEIKDKFISIQNNDEINKDKFLKEDSEVDSSRYYDFTYSHREFHKFSGGENIPIEMLPGVGKQIFNFLEIASTIDDDTPEATELLISKINKSKNSKSFVVNRSNFAKIVLSYNLLKEFVDDDDNERLFNLISDYIVDEKIEFLSYEFDQMDEETNKLVDDLNSSENKTLEFKGSFNLDLISYFNQKSDITIQNRIVESKKMRDSVLKNINAFLNTEGGTLYIGVVEKGDENFTEECLLYFSESKKLIDYESNYIIGIDKELKIYNTDEDGYIQSIENEIANKINEEALALIDICSLSIGEDGEKTIIKIEVQRSENILPCGEIFYQRWNKSAKPIGLNEIIDYNNQRIKRFNSNIIEEEELDEID
tara:strand:- start:136 stop:2496 length:2361 start_codon:yes stop_codon:yes gene_type:complete